MRTHTDFTNKPDQAHKIQKHRIKNNNEILSRVQNKSECFLSIYDFTDTM